MLDVATSLQITQQLNSLAAPPMNIAPSLSIPSVVSQAPLTSQHGAQPSFTPQNPFATPNSLVSDLLKFGLLPPVPNVSAIITDISQLPRYSLLDLDRYLETSTLRV